MPCSVSVALIRCLANDGLCGSEITSPYLPHWDCCTFRLVKTPCLIFMALIVHCAVVLVAGGPGGMVITYDGKHHVEIEKREAPFFSPEVNENEPNAYVLCFTSFISFAKWTPVGNMQ